MSIRQGDRVKVLRDIFRVESTPERKRTVYSSAGETGVVQECFWVVGPEGGPSKGGIWHAKVLIGEAIKTFRLTSLEKVGD